LRCTTWLTAKYVVTVLVIVRDPLLNEFFLCPQSNMPRNKRMKSRTPPLGKKLDGFETSLTACIIPLLRKSHGRCPINVWRIILFISPTVITRDILHKYISICMPSYGPDKQRTYFQPKLHHILLPKSSLKIYGILMLDASVKDL
jgi:hypothetical protein